jgi:hypothetical protein
LTWDPDSFQALKIFKQCVVDEAKSFFGKGVEEGSNERSCVVEFSILIKLLRECSRPVADRALVGRMLSRHPHLTKLVEVGVDGYEVGRLRAALDSMAMSGLANGGDEESQAPVDFVPYLDSAPNKQDKSLACLRTGSLSV